MTVYHRIKSSQDFHNIWFVVAFKAMFEKQLDNPTLRDQGASHDIFNMYGVSWEVFLGFIDLCAQWASVAACADM